MSRWIPDPAVLAALNGRAPFTYATLNKLFGLASSSGIDSAPYSIQRMFYPPGDDGVGLTSDNLERGEFYLPADLEISPAANISQTDVAGLMSGIIDVTAFGAVGDGVTNDYTAIRNAILAARDSSGTDRATVVWFPRKTYICNPGSATLPSIEIFPGLTYWGAAGCMVKRTDAVSSSNETPIFGTLSTWSADANASCIVRGFVIDGDGKGHTGIYISGGAFALVEQCIVQYCYYDNASYTNRSAVTIDTCDFAIVEDCILLDNGIACYISEGSAVVQRNYGGFSDAFASAWTNIGHRGVVRVAGGGPFGVLVAQNALTGANRAASGAQRHAAILSETDGAVIAGNAIQSFRRAGTSGVALGDSASIGAGVYNIVRGNRIFSTSRSQTSLALGVGVVAERNERNVVVGNQVFSQSEGKTTFAVGVKTTPASGITTYGKNVVALNQAGAGVLDPADLNAPDLANHYDIDRGDAPPINVAWCRLSEALDAQKRGTLKWRPLGSGLFLSSSTTPKGVAAMLRYGRDLVVGGGFNLSGAKDCDGLARFVPDRFTQIAAMGASSTKRVEALADIRGKLYVGGGFTSVDGATLRLAARTAKLDDALTDLGGGVSGGTSVNAFGEADGGIVLAGSITQVTKADASTLTANNFAIYDDDDDDFQSGWTTASINAQVLCAKRIGDQIWLGGNFTSVTSKAGVTAGAKYIARIRADLSAGPSNAVLNDADTGSHGLNGAVYAIEDAGGYLLLGGAFTTTHGGSAYARFLTLAEVTDTGVSYPYVVGILPPASVRAIAGVYQGDPSLLGGKRYIVGGQYFIGVVDIPSDLNQDGSIALLPTTGLMRLAAVHAIYADPENDLLFIGGNFYPNANALFPDANQVNQ